MSREYLPQGHWVRARRAQDAVHEQPVDQRVQPRDLHLRVEVWRQLETVDQVVADLPQQVPALVPERPEHRVDKRTWRGAWSAVVMNADGSPGVEVRADVGLRFGFLLPLGIALLASGLLLAAGPSLLSRRRSAGS
jgi:hypothetical protein